MRKQEEGPVIGVDEAGRGPLAGPVAVGAVVVPKEFDWKLVPGVNDSKKLSEKNREAIYLRANELQKEGKLDFKVSLVGASVIDKTGITNAVARGLRRALTGLKSDLDLDPQKCDVRLDGLLKAPPEFTKQKTITKGDQKEKVIGLASILAKVTRDRHMVRLAKKNPKYGFEIHKGYGTKAHRAAIRKYGLSDVHRKSYCHSYISLL